jgi:aldehyde:ferredoxin oxidoreductase
MDWAEGLLAAKRILTARHAFNAREGIDMDTLHLPKRFLEPLVAGPAAGAAPPPFEALREDYYSAMGWDAKSGKPTAETLAALGIS